jgi:pyruvate dehydrogenase E2 component (dihydrolipoamide acetyltransferase)
VLYAVTRVLPAFPEINALFSENQIKCFKRVNLAFAVDTPRGLTVPVIHNASEMGLKQLAEQANRLASACQAGTLSPNELNGGTFTVTNLGSLGIESFTPILNPPQVAILGVNAIQLKPILVDETVQFIQHIGFSLTIDHQAVDGAPGARFLKSLSDAITHIDLLLAM